MQNAILLSWSELQIACSPVHYFQEKFFFLGNF